MKVGSIILGWIDKLVPMILMAGLLGMITMASDITELKVKQANAQEEYNDIHKKIDEIHWYLIKKGKQ